MTYLNRVMHFNLKREGRGLLARDFVLACRLRVFVTKEQDQDCCLQACGTYAATQDLLRISRGVAEARLKMIFGT